MVSHTSRLKYRSDVDGLRGLAVLAVIAFHFFPGKFPGGFVGVDVFFVVSGFLITAVILGRDFTFRDFYARRVRRIFPALALLLGAALAFGWFALSPGDYEHLGKHTAAGAGFVSNMVLWGESGYFDSERKPLLHLWSLGIEEQFYLAWPLLLRASRRLRPSGPLGACVLVALVSFIASVALSTTDSSAAYFSPLSRFWELALGGLLTLLGRDLLPERLRAPASIVGLVLIAVAAFAITGADPFPGWRGLLPACGTALVIAAGNDALPNRALLSKRWLVWVGLISYPLYLWHWPLIAFAREVWGENPSTMVRGALAVAAFVPAWLTYRLVERPARKGGRRSVYVLCSAVGLVGLAGFWVHRAEGVPARGGERALYEAYFTNNPPEFRYATRHGLFETIREGCDFYDNRENKVRDAIDERCYTPTTPDAVLIWGDSHAQTYYHGLSKTLSPETSVLQVTTSACPPSLTPLSPDPLLACNKSNAFALKVVEARRPRVVILAQRLGHEKTDFNELALRLKLLGVTKVILVGPVPQWQDKLYRIVAHKLWEHTPERSGEGLGPRPFEIDRLLKERYGRGDPALTYVSAADFFCRPEGCLLYLDGDRRDGLVTHDYGHLSPRASRYFAEGVLARAVGAPGAR